MGLAQYKSRIQNFFYGLIQKRQLKLWDRMPRSQMRLYMYVLQNGNHISWAELVDDLVEIEYSANRQAAKQAIRRGLTNHILVENANCLSVAKPALFVIRFSSLWDSWRILIVPTATITVIFTYLHPIVTRFFATLTLIMIIALFVFEFFYTFKY